MNEAEQLKKIIPFLPLFYKQYYYVKCIITKSLLTIHSSISKLKNH